jgi:hypothetical protein
MPIRRNSRVGRARSISRGRYLPYRMDPVDIPSLRALSARMVATSPSPAVRYARQDLPRELRRNVEKERGRYAFQKRYEDEKYFFMIANNILYNLNFMAYKPGWGHQVFSITSLKGPKKFSIDSPGIKSKYDFSTFDAIPKYVEMNYNPQSGMQGIYDLLGGIMINPDGRGYRSLINPWTGVMERERGGKWVSVSLQDFVNKTVQDLNKTIKLRRAPPGPIGREVSRRENIKKSTPLIPDFTWWQ